MTIEIESVDVTAVQTAWVHPQNFEAPSAAVGGVSFPSSLAISPTDWNFFTQALERPALPNAAIRQLLQERTVLER